MGPIAFKNSTVHKHNTVQSMGGRDKYSVKGVEREIEIDIKGSREESTGAHTAVTRAHTVGKSNRKRTYNVQLTHSLPKGSRTVL